jgi:hypothetical protein
LSELQTISQLPDPYTGELLPATLVNAAGLRLLAAERIRQLRDLQAACDYVLAEEARRQGTKTLHLAEYTVTLTGGTTVEYDAHELMAGLMEVGCPPERINDAVTETVTYKVNRRVLTQLRAANPNYAEAIDAAGREVPVPWKARVE